MPLKSLKKYKIVNTETELVFNEYRLFKTAYDTCLALNYMAMQDGNSGNPWEIKHRNGSSFKEKLTTEEYEELRKVIDSELKKFLEINNHDY